MNPTGTSVPIPSFVYTVFLFKKDDMQGRSKAYGTVQDICISKPDIAIYLFHVMVTRIPKRILYALWKNGKSPCRRKWHQLPPQYPSYICRSAPDFRSYGW